MISPTQAVGFNAEKRVANYLRKNGLSILARNFHSRMGEIDIIAQEGDHIVFIEVRSRTKVRDRFGTTLETVSFNKQQRLISTAQTYLTKYHLLEKHPCRFDVISVNHKTQRLRWIKHAFEVESLP